MPATLILANGKEHSKTGKVVFVDRAVDVKTGTIRIRGEFPNPGELLRPGMFARMKLDFGTRPDSILVPQKAVIALQGKSFAWVIGPDNKASQREVTVGQQFGESLLITDKLKAGDRIVEEGIQKLRDGVEVKTMTPEQAAAMAKQAEGTPKAKVSLLSLQAERYLLMGEVPGPVGNSHPLIVPAGCFEAKDGHLNISIGTETQWRRLCAAMDLPEIVDDPRFATFDARLRHRSEVLRILTSRFGERPRDEWLRRLEAGDIACGPVYRVDEVFRDPQVLATEMVREIAHPTIGALKLVGFPFKLNRTQPAISSYPPRYREHTREDVDAGVAVREACLV